MVITLSGNGLLQYRLVGSAVWHFIEKNEIKEITVRPSQKIEFQNISPTTHIIIGGDVSDISIPMSSLSDYTLSFNDLRNLNNINVSSDAIATDVSRMLFKSKIKNELNLNIAENNNTIGSAYYLTDLSESNFVPLVSRHNSFSRFNKIEIENDNKVGIVDNIKDIVPDQDNMIDLRGTISVETLSGKRLDFLSKHNIPVFRDNRIIPAKYPYYDRTIDDQYTFEADFITSEFSGIAMNRNNGIVEFNEQDTLKNATMYTFEMDMYQPILTNDMFRRYPTIIFNEQDISNDTVEYTFEMDMYQPILTNDMFRNSSIIFNEQDISNDTVEYTFEMDIYQPILTNDMFRRYPTIIFNEQDTTKKSFRYTFEMDIIDAYEIQE